MTDRSETTSAPAARRRGRIPQSAWPRIVHRYRSGETLSAIAREYGCTPSAIAYIVRKAEEKGLDGEAGDQGELTMAASGEEDNLAEEDEADELDDDGDDDGDDERADGDDERADEGPDTADTPVESPAPSAGAQSAPGTGRREEAARPAQPSTTLSISSARPAQGDQPRTPSSAARPAQPAMQQRLAEPQRSSDAVGGEDEGVAVRLGETNALLAAAYADWHAAAEQDVEAARQTLSDALHEARRVLARIEIEMAASRRDEQSMRPIPIPTHRANQRRA